MKKVIALLMATALAAMAHSIQVEWGHSPDIGVSGYRLYLGASPGFNITNAMSYIQVGYVTNAWLTNIADGTYYIKATALEGGLESDPSNEVQLAIPRGPTNLRLKAAIR